MNNRNYRTRFSGLRLLLSRSDADEATAKQTRIYRNLAIIHIAEILLPLICFNILGPIRWDVDMGPHWHGPTPYGLTDIFAVIQSAILYYSGDYFAGGRFVRMLQVVGFHVGVFFIACIFLSVGGYRYLNLEFQKGNVKFSGPPSRVLWDTEIYLIPTSLILMVLWLFVRSLTKGQKVTAVSPGLLR